MDQPQQEDRLVWEGLDRSDDTESAKVIAARVARLVLEFWEGQQQEPRPEERVIAF